MRTPRTPATARFKLRESAVSVNSQTFLHADQMKRNLKTYHSALMPSFQLIFFPSAYVRP